MKPSRVLPGALVVAAVAVASMFAAAPASAATLPPGQKITVVDQWTDQFYNVNPSNAIGTPVGTATLVEDWVSGVDVDDTGVGYASATYFYYDPIIIDIEDDEELTAGPIAPERSLVPFGYVPDGGAIYKADANTGKLTDGKYVYIDLPGFEDPLADECSAIDYSKGVILAVCYTGYGSELTDTAYYGTIEFGDGDFAHLTPITTLYGEYFHYITAIAVNPVDGAVYGFSVYDSALVQFTGDDDSVKFMGNIEDYDVWGADFDRSGQLWITVSEVFDEVPALAALNPSLLSLATFDFAANAAVIVDEFATEEPNEIENPEAITVWGVLAATGSTMSIAPAIAASGILLLGALMAAGTMVLRRRSSEV